MDDGGLTTERVRMAARPQAPVIGYQRWDRLLFIHFALEPAALRALVHPRLTVDTYDGRAYVGLTPFTLVRGRLRFLPPLPRVSTFHELNVRTYVHLEGRQPGVWFFSLDASSALAALAARATVRLPYFPARIRRDSAGDAMGFDSQRLIPARPPATLRVSWRVGEALGSAAAGSLEQFLVERYVLYSAVGGRLIRGRVHHHPWPLHAARLVELDERLAVADGLPPLQGTPLLHYSQGVDVEFFPFAPV